MSGSRVDFAADRFSQGDVTGVSSLQGMQGSIQREASLDGDSRVVDAEDSDLGGAPQLYPSIGNRSDQG